MAKALSLRPTTGLPLSFALPAPPGELEPVARVDHDVVDVPPHVARGGVGVHRELRADRLTGERAEVEPARDVAVAVAAEALPAGGRVAEGGDGLVRPVHPGLGRDVDAVHLDGAGVVEAAGRCSRAGASAGRTGTTAGRPAARCRSRRPSEDAPALGRTPAVRPRRRLAVGVLPPARDAATRPVRARDEVAAGVARLAVEERAHGPAGRAARPSRRPAAGSWTGVVRSSVASVAWCTAVQSAARHRARALE